MKTMQSSFSTLKNELIGLGLIMAGWMIASIFVPAYIVPSPFDIWANLGELIPDQFFHHLTVTLYRVLIGFCLAWIIGTFLGWLAFLRGWGGQLNSAMTALQILPGVILGVIFLLVCGIGHTAPILLVAILVLPTLAVNTYNGLFSRDIRQEEYLRSQHVSKWMVYRLVYFPALIPNLQSNINLGVSLAIKVVVLGEFIGSQDGLGFLLNTARIHLDMKAVFFYLLVLLVFSLIIQALRSVFFSVYFRKYFHPG